MLNSAILKLVMKSLATFLILFSFVGIAVFGFAAMGHGENHSRSGCIAAAEQNTDCANDNLASFLAVHFNAFQNISSATFNQNYINAIALLWLIALSFLITSIKIATPILKRVYAYQSKSSTPNSLLKLNAWLSRHENSPASF